jgi:phenylpyruvate tautomerase PptA (4-oxalocrotonate tautomerase family)
MPLFVIEAPTGVGSDAKRKMMKSITEAIDEAFHFPDTRIWLHETAPENIAQDGVIGAEQVRPVGFLEAPELVDVDVKRKMVAKIHDAIDQAYQGLANTEQTLLLMNHYPLRNAAWIGRLQSDNPEIVAAVEQLNG